MEPTTIAVLAFTAAFLSLCVWIERNSRRQQATPSTEEPDETTVQAEEEPEIREQPRRRNRLRS
jgi:hypothetical protein